MWCPGRLGISYKSPRIHTAPSFLENRRESGLCSCIWPASPAGPLQTPEGAAFPCMYQAIVLLMWELSNSTCTNQVEKYTASSDIAKELLVMTGGLTSGDRDCQTRDRKTSVLPAGIFKWPPLLPPWWPCAPVSFPICPWGPPPHLAHHDLHRWSSFTLWPLCRCGQWKHR